jgi:hypothetical protein
MKPWAEALVNRMVLFAPIWRRAPMRYVQPPTGPAWRVVTVEDQWRRFVEDVPAGETPIPSCAHFEEAEQDRLLVVAWPTANAAVCPTCGATSVHIQPVSVVLSGLPSQEAVDLSRQDTLVLSKPLRWPAATLLTTVSNRTEGRGHEQANAGCRERPLGLPACLYSSNRVP